MGGRCAVGAAVTVWGALLLGQALGVRGALACLLALPGVAAIAWRAPPRVGTVLTLAALALAGLARGGAWRQSLEHGVVALGEDPAPRWIRARVVEHPLREADTPLATVRLLVPVLPVPAGTAVRLRLPPGCEAEWGDTLTALATLERPPARSNPGGFSARDAAASLGIALQGRGLAARATPARWIAGWARATAVRWRRAAEQVLARGLSAESRQLVTPLVVGDRSALPPVLGADLRAAGLTHLLALSGLHVVWLAGMVRMLAAALGAGVGTRAWAGGACAVFYALVAGPIPSLMRAVATECLLAWARIAQRALDPLQALALSVLALLAIAPGWAGDLGFQLSCAATLGLLAIGPYLAEHPRLADPRLKALLAPFIPTVAAQTVALPLLIDRFHALPWTALASNLVAVPVSGALLAAAWLAIGGECLAPGSGALFLSACEVLSGALRGVAQVAGRAPGALIATGCEPGIAWLAGLGAALLALSLPRPRTVTAAAAPVTSRRRLAATGLGVFASALALLLALTARPLLPPPGRWWLVALDVGQGDAIALAFPDGWWLVDAGPRTPHFDAGAGTVLPFLRWAGVRRLEQLVLTHDDGDHTGGARALLSAGEVASLVVPVAVPGVPGPGSRFAAAPVPIRRAARGDTLHAAPRVSVRWPPAGEPCTRDNAAGLVLAIDAGGGAALLAADVDSTVEAGLSLDAPLAVLKVAHHGSASSSGASFLARARPGIAIVSCGRHNAFGHPSAGALARLSGCGASIQRTDREGAVWLEFSGFGVRRIDWRHGPGWEAERASAPPLHRSSESGAATVPRLARAGPRW
jgi:competence protein ComEC